MRTVINDGLRLLGNAVVKQATDDYVMYSYYIFHNPLTEEVNMRADHEKLEREKKINEYIERAYKSRSESLYGKFKRIYIDGAVSHTAKEIEVAKLKMEASLEAFKKMLKNDLPTSLDALGEWEKYRNCILGARASKEQLRKDLRGPYLGMLMGNVDPDYILERLDKKIQYMAAHNSWDIRPTEYDRKDLNINVGKPRRTW